jgi:hypothetical protein
LQNTVKVGGGWHGVHGGGVSTETPRCFAHGAQLYFEGASIEDVVRDTNKHTHSHSQTQKHVQQTQHDVYRACTRIKTCKLAYNKHITATYYSVYHTDRGFL